MDDDLYDIVIGYCGGNWIYEWVKQVMDWQQKVCQEQDVMCSGCYWFYVLMFYNIVVYLYLKGDELVEQVQVLVNCVYEEVVQWLFGLLCEMEFVVSGGLFVIVFLYMLKGDGLFLMVFMCGGLDVM